MKGSGEREDLCECITDNKNLHCKFTAWNLYKLDLFSFPLPLQLPQRIPLKYTNKNAKIIIMIDIYFFNNFDRKSLLCFVAMRAHNFAMLFIVNLC